MGRSVGPVTEATVPVAGADEVELAEAVAVALSRVGYEIPDWDAPRSAHHQFVGDVKVEQLLDYSIGDLGGMMATVNVTFRIVPIGGA